MTDEELLKYLFNDKTIYSLNKLYKYAKMAHPKITQKIVRIFFINQQSTQMNNEKVSEKIFKPIYSESNYGFQLDLTFFPRYKKQNNGYDVLFTAININTRFVYAYYCQDKSTDNILNLLKKMESKTIINRISCDNGKEFNNEKLKNYCEENEIKLFFIKNDGHKLGIINRFHRTLKEELTTYFINNDTVKWINAIDDIIYN